MNWYWIVLLIFAYVFIGTCVFSVLCRDAKNKDMEPFFAFASIFWPLIIVSIPFALISLAADKLVSKFYKRKEESK